SAPACPSATATALPIPESPPVTNAFCPRSSGPGLTGTSGITTGGNRARSGFCAMLYQMYDYASESQHDHAGSRWRVITDSNVPLGSDWGHDTFFSLVRDLLSPACRPH